MIKLEKEENLNHPLTFRWSFRSQFFVAESLAKHVHDEKGKTSEKSFPRCIDVNSDC